MYMFYVVLYCDRCLQPCCTLLDSTCRAHRSWLLPGATRLTEAMPTHARPRLAHWLLTQATTGDVFRGPDACLYINRFIGQSKCFDNVSETVTVL